MTQSARLEREKAFHDHRFGKSDSERDTVRTFYAANKDLKARYTRSVSGLCQGMDLLEYGCGPGNGSQRWLEQGARVTGIDISEEAIKKARKNIAETPFDAQYLVMDAEHTDFDDGQFDVVVGTGILHHLDLKGAYQELSRICASHGHIVFVEPLGHNPYLNLFRRLTPKMRTVDEHPLKMKDIALAKNYFQNVQAEYFTFFTVLSVPFRRTKSFVEIYAFLRRLHQGLFALPFFRRYAWMVLIHANTPLRKT